MAKFRVNEVKSFFSKTLMDNLELQDDLITIYKPFNKTVKLRWIKEGRTKDIIEGIDAPTQIDVGASSETFWLSKVLGDYNISKMGDNFLFTNGDKAMLLQRAD